MSAEATGWVFRHSPYTGAAFAVHLAIADSVNDQHENRFWMKLENLAEKARVTRQTASQVVQRMASDGFLELVEEEGRGLGGRSRPTVWLFLMPETVARSDSISPETVGSAPETVGRADTHITQRTQEPKDSSPTGMAQGAEKANGQTFSQRLALELHGGHGVRWGSYETRHESVRALLEEALARLPEKRHHPTAMGVIADYVAEVQGWKMTPQARNHTARLVKLHKPLTVLDAYGQAMAWGAGIAPEYAEDPLSLSKYVAGVLGGKRSRA